MTLYTWSRAKLAYNCCDVFALEGIARALCSSSFDLVPFYVLISDDELLLVLIYLNEMMNFTFTTLCLWWCHD